MFLQGCSLNLLVTPGKAFRIENWQILFVLTWTFVLEYLARHFKFQTVSHRQVI